MNQMIFDSINASSNTPYIQVTYGASPNTPQSLAIQSTHVSGATNFVNTTRPTFSAYVSDPSFATVQAAYTLTDTTTSTIVFSKTLGSSTTSDGTSTYTISSGSPLIDGHSYQLQAWGYDGTSYSLNSQTTTFAIDATAPAAPTVASTTYSANAWTNSSSGAFTFTDSATDVQTWFYAFNGGSVTASNSGTCTTTCTLASTLTPPPGWNTLSVWAMDAAGNLSSAVTFTFGADQAGVTSPTANQTVSANSNVPLAGTVPLDATGPYAGTNVQFEYQLNGGSWTNIPYGDVKEAGTTLTGWPVASLQIPGGLIAKAPQTSGAPALSWNVASTLASLSDTAESQLISVEAVFETSGSSWTSPPQTMTYMSGSVDNGDSTTTAGPCTVSLWSGTCQINTSDASIQTPNQGSLGIDRTFVSNSLPTAGPFGPGWTASLPTDASDVNTLIDTSNLTAQTGQVTIEGPTTAVIFVPNGSGYVLAGNQTGDETLTKSGSGASTTFTYLEPGDSTDGSSDTQEVIFTEFAQPAGGPSISTPWTYQAKTVEPTGPDGTADAVGETFNATTGYPTQMLAPQPSGVNCASAWAVGCEALNFTYNANNEITNVTLKTANSSGTAVYTDVACYIYGATSHRLNEEWDPRTVSSSCNFASPVLPIQYSYNGNGQVLTVTPPGLAAWNINYNASGAVSKIYRTHSATYGGATQQTQFLYNAPIGSTTANTHPDLSAATDATWGEYDDPVTATAVFRPGSTYSTTDLRPATVYGLDAEGEEVNVANFDGTTQADWDVSTSQYDPFGNDVMDLTPQNRAYVVADNCSEAGMPSGCSQTILANALSTIRKYSTNGLDLNKIFQPTNTNLVTASSQTQTVARPVTQYTYGTVNYPTTPPSDYSTGGPLDDLVSEVAGTSEGAASVITAETDQRTTTYAYGLSSTDHSGWDYGTSVSTDVSMSGTDIVHQTVIDDTTGLTTQVRQPSSVGTTASPATTVTTFYTAGTTNIAGCVDTAWAGMPCTTGPGAQPSGEPSFPGLPVTQVTAYDYLLRPTTTVSTVTDASGVQQSQTTTVTYEGAGLATEEQSVATTGGLGASVPTQTLYYDASTGLPTVESSTAATNCSSTGPLCTSYDDFGNQISFTDTSGAVTTTSPSITDEPGAVTLKSASGATIQTAAFTYAAGSEFRDLPTSLTYTGGSGYSSVGTYSATYNADGTMTHESLPDGTSLTQAEDTDGNVILRKYVNSATDLYAEVDEAYNSHGEIAQELRPDIDNFVAYGYDNDARLQQAQDIYANGSCTTRTYNLDVDSNRTRLKSYPAVAGGGCSTTTSPVTQSLSYDSSDRILNSGSASGIAYDAFGRITSLPSGLVSGGSNETIGYFTNDMVNRLTEGSTTQTWTLDPAERDYAATTSGSSVATTNHYSSAVGDSPTWSVLVDASGVSSTSVNDADLGGELAATSLDHAGSTSITYQLSDPQGNVIGIANPASPTEMVTPLLTDEFGNPTDVYGNLTSGQRYSFQGSNQRDASSLGGVVLMGVRGYLPSDGRFLSTDPEIDASANPYDYCNQDPVNAADITGEAPFTPSPHVVQAWHDLHFLLGFSATDAAAIIGNLMQESGPSLDTRNVTGAHYHGIAQWGDYTRTGHRWQKEGAFATEYSCNRYALNCQVTFIYHELHGSYAPAYRIIKGDRNNLYLATKDVCRYYEQAVNGDGSLQNLPARENYATEVYAYFT